ncbi:MAG: YifB family Mg chelatase-like AAA ATPase [Clostridia bacterium]|nr:YifB family Mg chelatase-like AAA ATPase [Clostridia bacterium]
MLAQTLGYGLSGVNGFAVKVEVYAAPGLPALEIIGLPDASVKESRDRVSAAIVNSGFAMPVARLTVNLAPADMKKEGPAFDLPIALGVLTASNQLYGVDLNDTLMLGELSLDGTLQPVRGALPMVISASEQGIESVILPEGNAQEVACIQGVKVYPARNLRQVVEHLRGKEPIPAQVQRSYQEILQESTLAVDLAQVQGQLGARRALEVAAAGGHNMLMIGVPGSGKTMLARCLPGILPPMTFDEALETTRIHSIAGRLRTGGGLMVTRPFCAPHHSASVASLIGGGSAAKPGEVSMAHNGVLFLDELPEFSRPALEALRQPLEDGVVSVTRVQNQAQYQSSFMLIASMNPCPCGYYGSKTRACRCTQKDIRRYLDRVSGPLLDRIDIQVEVDAVPVKEINQSRPAESSAVVAERVRRAREIQQERYRGEGIHCNAQLDAKLSKKYCALDPQATQILHMAVERMGMSMRAYGRVLKVARTIADLRGAEHISTQDVAEAIQFRELDGKYWR